MNNVLVPRVLVWMILLTGVFLFIATLALAFLVWDANQEIEKSRQEMICLHEVPVPTNCEVSRHGQ